jgi:hypothetical protein
LFIKLEGNEHFLMRTILGPDNLPGDVVLASLESDPELNFSLPQRLEGAKNPNCGKMSPIFSFFRLLKTSKDEPVATGHLSFRLRPPGL